MHCILAFEEPVGGYNVECSAAFCVGRRDYAKKLSDAMLAAHDTGAENMKKAWSPSKWTR